MAFEWTDTLGPFLGATDRAIQSGLIAAAEVYAAEVKRRLLHGYTSGTFVTGNNVNAVARGDVEPVPGGFQIAVGSTQMDPPYPLYWELGHQNLYTGKHERVEVWVPAMTEMHGQLEQVIADEIKAVDG